MDYTYTDVNHLHCFEGNHLHCFEGIPEQAALLPAAVYDL